MIRNIIFDFGKVLVDYDFDSALDKYTDDKVELARFKACVTAPEFVDRCDRGIDSLHSIYDELRKEHPEWLQMIDLFETTFQDIIIGEMPGMTDVLQELKAQGYHLYGLTNWSSEVYPVIERYPIFRLLEGWIISSEEHLIKPDVAIYQRLCEKFNLKAEECIFTDDKQCNTDGAAKAGMKAIVFRNAKQFKQELKAD